MHARALLRCKPALTGKLSLAGSFFGRKSIAPWRIVSHIAALSCWCGEYFRELFHAQEKLGCASACGRIWQHHFDRGKP
jgi:hypothetical protein